MKTIITIITIGFYLFYPAITYSDSSRINAAQILWMGCKNYTEAEDSILKLKAAGVNTLIFRVFHNRYDRVYGFANPPTPPFTTSPSPPSKGGDTGEVKGGKGGVGVYFNTSYAPVVDDILGKLTEIAHKNDLKIFAFMTTRKSDWLIENNPEFLESVYDFKNEAIVKGESLNIFNPEVIERLKGVYRDLARYDIDGILFQDDLILRHTEGYSSEARSLFLRDTGFKANPIGMYNGVYQKNGKYLVSSYTPLFWEWSGWKSRKLSRLASELMSAVREVNPNLKFAINLYYETLTSPRNALAWLSQDIDEMMKYKFDYYAVMAYHRQMKKEMGFPDERIYEILNDMTANITNKIAAPEKILMKVQVIAWDTRISIPEDEIERVSRFIKKGGDVNMSFVPVTEDTPLGIIKRLFDN
ncbi:MAG: family 10 glycosylhydrolase [Nitrospinae bacterium]|nr:family 10 glycosylhydrolase [Nitrospinota bacterium]MBI3814038.1 family 10 glycosylhydrolase [Nitrospinota bacterium]